MTLSSEYYIFVRPQTKAEDEREQYSGALNRSGFLVKGTPPSHFEMLDPNSEFEIKVYEDPTLKDQRINIVAFKAYVPD